MVTTVTEGLRVQPSQVHGSIRIEDVLGMRCPTISYAAVKKARIEPGVERGSGIFGTCATAKAAK